jgi:prepilin-type N-terminal cleavage/methylation domain-containing protein
MRRRRPGFTLLEVLVTLVIVAMFSSVVYAVFLQAVVDTRFTEESVFAGRLGESILSAIERDLSACLPASGETSHFAGSIDVGGASRLDLLTAVDSRALIAGKASEIVKVTYRTFPSEDRNGRWRRLYRVEEYGGGEDLGVEAKYTLLDRAVKEFDLRYFDGAAWREEWAEGGLPRAVRATIVIEREVQPDATGPVRPAEMAFTTVVVVPVAG